MPPPADATERQRARMVAQQLRRRGIADERVLAAMAEIPRESFVEPDQAGLAYEDHPLPIGEGQTISQPYIVAAMAEAARIAPTNRVLEVGAGSGYAAAVLSRLAAEVFAIERHDSLARNARRRLADLGYTNVTLHTGDGSLGWPGHAPYDVILVSAGAPRIPETLVAQLADNGRLIIPAGEGRQQTLLRLTRTGDQVHTEDLGKVVFVPLIGKEGWDP
jgi:protein-L-isoaspartate(D-aspartate) O-methyltransferase